MKTYQAIIFDMDGVLVDTEQYYYDRRQQFMTSKGIDISHVPARFFVGGNLHQVWKKVLGAHYDQWDVPALQAEYDQWKIDHPLPYQALIFDDVQSVLLRLKDSGYRLGLASSTNLVDIQRMLQENQLEDFFEVVLSGESFPETKPHPAIYLEAMRQLAVGPERTLIIEDSEKGIQAGVASGADVAAITDLHFGMDQSQAMGTWLDLSSIVEALAL